MAALGGLVAISLGLGLAAASGFRVFLPPPEDAGGKGSDPFDLLWQQEGDDCWEDSWDKAFSPTLTF